MVGAMMKKTGGQNGESPPTLFQTFRKHEDPNLWRTFFVWGDGVGLNFRFHPGNPGDFTKKIRFQ